MFIKPGGSAINHINFLRQNHILPKKNWWIFFSRKFKIKRCRKVSLAHASPVHSFSFSLPLSFIMCYFTRFVNTPDSPMYKFSFKFLKCDSICCCYCCYCDWICCVFVIIMPSYSLYTHVYVRVCCCCWCYVHLSLTLQFGFLFVNIYLFLFIHPCLSILLLLIYHSIAFFLPLSTLTCMCNIFI